MALSADDLIRLVESSPGAATAALAELGGTEGVAWNLNVSLEHGLNSADDDDLEDRQRRYGKNYVEPESAKTFVQLMWHSFQDLTMMVLAAAGFVSLVLGFVPFTASTPAAGRNLAAGSSHAWIEGVAILFAVFIVVSVSAMNEYQKEKQFRALNAVKEDETIKVIRDGVPAEVSKFDLVVGEIVRVDVGDIVPADGLVFDETDLRVDESSMTGESLLVVKNSKSAPFLLSGTKVMEGVGKMLVICVGSNSQAGIIASLIRNGNHNHNATVSKTNGGSADEYTLVSSPKEGLVEQKLTTDLQNQEPGSPLQGKLDRLTIFVSKVAITVAVLVFAALAVRYSIVKFAINGEEWSQAFIGDFVSHFILGVTILVVAIPEGLPLAVTIALAFSVKKMLEDNNLVRHLSACETMGSATTICSDKTGTLTTNRMTVVHCYMSGNEYESFPTLQLQMSPTTKAILCDSICFNSTAEILPPKQVGAQPEHTGNKTECALLQFVADLGEHYADVRKASHICHMLTFSSAKKRMSVVVPLTASKCRIFTKGASEIVLELCTSQLNLDGTTSAFGAAERNAVKDNIIEKYASQAYRTLSLAYRDVDASPEVVKNWSDEEIETDLTCICIVGIEDPVRDEVPESIRHCNEAGIVVRMVTGDNIATARSIALKCGIISPDDGSLVMEGSVFRARVLDANGNINQSEFDKIWPMLRVLARSSPKDKFTLVSGLQVAGQVVAVTGDGTNDAPALKKADVGFAMGICGTAVAKDASDIILMDDNFRSIVNAVKWGRNVYDSICKFLQFQLTVNVVAVTMAMTGAVVLEESPLTAVQLLWVNLIMNAFASLALATDMPTDAMLHRKPYPRNKALLSQTMTKHIFGQAVYQLAVLMPLTFVGDSLLGIESGQKYKRGGATGPTLHYTMVFNTFVLFQLFNEINARRIHDEPNVFEGISRNRTFVVMASVQVILQACIVQFGSVAFGCVALNATQWAICVAIGSTSLPVRFALRWFSARLMPQW
ncbi:hypothetical protein DYB26_009733 [Aphanomyces astaci]|nr:hypothetical protein DYB26_009733 [Aphanomyces astaci]